MRISKVSIKNFRNFSDVEIKTGQSLILVGANATGKSNFIHALRLIIDPNLPRRERFLTADDFWRGIDPWRGNEIRISIELTDFVDNQDLRSLLDSYNFGEAGVARLTYLYRPKGNIDPEQSDEKDYEYVIFGGNETDNELDSSLYRHLNLRVIDALRNAEAELVGRRMPLRSLLELYGVNTNSLQNAVTHIEALNDVVKQVPQVSELEAEIQNRLSDMKQHIPELKPVLRLMADNAQGLLRSLKVLLDDEHLLPLSTTSLGLANILFLAMYLLEIEKREQIHAPNHGSEYEFIILAVEEPEAHLHPHIQRLLFRDFLKRKDTPLILSTHSPHIASVTPIDSIVMLRQFGPLGGTKAYSSAQISLSSTEIQDLERYMDVTRAEILFARGVILVEGDAEEYLIPAFAKLLNYDLDKYGITVCNIRGTHFASLIKLVNQNGLNIPFAILTDGDKFANLKNIAIPRGQKDGLISEEEADLLRQIESPESLRVELERRGVAFYFGLKRCRELLDLLSVDAATIAAIEAAYNNLQWEQAIQLFGGVGIFINELSLEPELIDSGYADELLTILEECDVGPSVMERLRGYDWTSKPVGYDGVSYCVKQISDVGKGRVAQSLCTKLRPTPPGTREIPRYVREAIEYLISKVDSSN